MKKYKLLTTIVLILLSFTVVAQEKKEVIVKTEVSDATVFINGAQITRKKMVDLLQGKTKVRFTSLSPYIDAKSIQIKIAGEVMVVSVNHQMNYTDSVQQNAKVKVLTKQLEDVTDKITLEDTNRDIIKEELAFLNENKHIGGANTGLSLITLKETANYYKERLSALKLEDIELVKSIEKLNNEKAKITNEINQLEGSAKRDPMGEVVVEVECKKPTRANMELVYYVKNAGWYPTYDIRSTDINKPIELIYKANVRQNTKEDWTNINLKVSSADPNLGNIAPELKTYYLNYYTQAPRYTTQTDNNQVSGVVLEEGTNEPLIGVSVKVKGTTVGAMTDLDGRYSIAIPSNSNTLEFSYIGYNTKAQNITGPTMNVALSPNNQMLDEVIVMGYGTENRVSSQLAGAVGGVTIGSSKSKSGNALLDIKRADIAMPINQVENQTAVEFEIKIPYTIKSDNKSTMIEVDRYLLPANYEYYSVPKVNKDAFLLANIVDWEKYNLLDGEANIFFENTYVGKTVLDMRYVYDTLSISLGRDKNVVVNREKVKDYNTKKFFGNKKEDTRAWKITVRNNKNQSIDMVVLDQIPVSTNQEIEVEAENLSGGALNKNDGEVKWKLNLNPSDKKEMELKYKVKYPKNRTLTVE